MSFAIATDPVQLVSSDHELEGQVDASTDLVVLGTGGVDETVRFEKLWLDVLLLGLDFTNGDGLGQVGVDQFLFLAFQRRDPFALGRQHANIVGSHGRELDVDDCFQFVLEPVGEPDVSPALGDSGFDSVSGEVWQFAVGTPAMSAEAEEVGVLAATAFGVGVTEPFPAAVTEHHAFQVLLAFPPSVPGEAPGGQDGLHRVERLLRNDRGVFAVVLDAAVAEASGVVRVGQHPMHLRPGERGADEAGDGSALEPTSFEFVGDLGDAPQPGFVRLELRADGICPVNSTSGFDRSVTLSEEQRRAVQLTDIRAAYLIAFATLGYRWAASPRLAGIRAAIRTGDLDPALGHFDFICPDLTGVGIAPFVVHEVTDRDCRTIG